MHAELENAKPVGETMLHVYWLQKQQNVWQYISMKTWFLEKKKKECKPNTLTHTSDNLDASK